MIINNNNNKRNIKRELELTLDLSSSICMAIPGFLNIPSTSIALFYFNKHINLIYLP